MSTSDVKKDELAAIVAGGSAGGGRRRRKRLGLILSGVAALLVVGFCATRSARPGSGTRFHTAEVTQGELLVKVTATGKLQPTNEVQVGSEVSGLVDAVYVDANDYVKKGQILARLDVSKLQDQVTNARAALTSAEAGVLQAKASVQEAAANLARLRQVAELSGGKVPSKAEMETAEATSSRAEANLASAGAQVQQARASLSSAEINLSKASIRSPIDGVVLSRSVEPGQTVAASFQVATLFTIAQDLKKMELQVDVAEADVGQVREGQEATFTVDAQGNRKYAARIRRVSYGSQTTSGVVTYTTILTVNNDDLTLRPGMTATAEIVTVHHAEALMVPNAALRFTPPAVAAPVQSRSVLSRILPGPPRFMTQRRQAATNGKPATGATGQVFILKDGVPLPVPVTVGPTNGRLTEVTGAELAAGQQVITESVGATAS